MFLACCIASVTLGASSPPAAETPVPFIPERIDTRVVASIPVQSGGRHPPLDTLARIAVGDVTGRVRWQGHDPVAVVLSWTLEPQAWTQAPIIQVEHEPLKQATGLAVDRRRFSLAELMRCTALVRLLDEAEAARMQRRAPTALQRQAADVGERIGLLQSFFDGGAIAMAPGAGDAQRPWTPCGAATSHPRAAQLRGAWEKLGDAFRRDDPAAFTAAANQLAATLRETAPPGYPDERDLRLELQYNRLHPFRLAWVLMTVAMLLGLAGLYLCRRAADALTAVGMAAALTMFAYGFALRWLVAGRAPLSNMYESLTVLAGAVALFALAFFVMTRQRLVPVVAAGLSAGGFILADVLPLDAAITTLPPVLRNTVWLTIHVLTILLGYGAAALSMGMAHVQLGCLALRPARPDRAHEIMRLNHWILLVAVVFLTAGIVFGAVWANASWGRYWGWDPKETWSLITLLGYLSLLHAGSVGWIREFGSAVANVACFQLVLMTYYGVNFVLGTGLHSYGFGGGGLPWVGGYVAAEALLVALATVRYRRLHPYGPAHPERAARGLPLTA